MAAAAAWFALGDLGVVELLGWRWDYGLAGAFVVGAALGALDWRRFALGTAVAALAALLIVHWIPAPSALARGLIRNDSLPTEPVDAVVVLAASMTAEGLLSPIAADRLTEGIRLIRIGTAANLVVSRLEFPYHDGPVTSDRDQRRMLAAAGVAPVLHIIGPVGSTRREAALTRQLANRQGWHRLVVVTSPTHTRRACATYERLGFEVTCRASADRRIAWGRIDQPRERALAFGEYLYETVGWWHYRIRGWIGTAGAPAPGAPARGATESADSVPDGPLRAR